MRSIVLQHVCELGTGDSTKKDEFSEKFQRGGGGHFQSKNLCCRFWTYKQGFLSMKVEEKSQHDFPKIGRDGGLKALW